MENNIKYNKEKSINSGYGVYVVRGEDINDVSSHSITIINPLLGHIQGTFEEVLEYASQMDGFYNSGLGGHIYPIKEHTKKPKETIVLKNGNEKPISFNKFEEDINKIFLNSTTEVTDDDKIGFYEEELRKLKEKKKDKETRNRLENTDFYMLTVKGNSGSKHRHSDFDDALRQATVLSKRENHEVYIMGIRAIVAPDNKYVIDRVNDSNEDEEVKNDKPSLDTILTILDMKNICFLDEEKKDIIENISMVTPTKRIDSSTLTIETFKDIVSEWNNSNILFVFENFSKIDKTLIPLIFVNFQDKRTILTDKIDNMDAVLLNKLILL